MNGRERVAKLQKHLSRKPIGGKWDGIFFVMTKVLPQREIVQQGIMTLLFNLTDCTMYYFAVFMTALENAL